MLAWVYTCTYVCMMYAAENDVCLHVHTYIHAHIHTYIYAYTHTYNANPAEGDVFDCVFYMYLDAYIHTYIHICIHTYIHTYIHTVQIQLKAMLS